MCDRQKFSPAYTIIAVVASLAMFLVLQTAVGEDLVIQHDPAVKKDASLAEKKPESSLPLKRVVLFSSGVGYFAHAGQVNDDAKVELKFKVKDINDLLKSMVVQDYGGGHVSTIGYGSNDPLEKRLSSFAIDLNGSTRLSALLGQIRGEQVEVDAPNKIVGTIIGLETRKQEIGKDRIIESDVLNLLTDDGIRSIPLESAGRVRLLNEKLNGELRKALAALASASVTDKKTVTLDFHGQARARWASATCRKRQSGRPAIGWCSTKIRPRCCKAGLSWKIPRKRTGTTCG